MTKTKIYIMSWKPIKTAPRDGTTVYLSNGVFVREGRWGSWVNSQEDWKEVPCWGVYICDADPFYNELIDESGVTHWDHIPPKPEPPDLT